MSGWVLGGRGPRPAPPPILPPVAEFWSAGSPINAPLPANAVLDPNSASIASVLTTAAPGLSIVAYGTTIYRATAQTPRVTTGAVGSGAGLEVRNIGMWGAQSPFAGLDVPLDPSWRGAPGYVGETYRDGACVVIDTNGRIFSFFVFDHAQNGNPARVDWGGWTWGRPTDSLIEDISGNATGAGISRLAGVLTRADIDGLLQGKPIQHALVFATRFARGPSGSSNYRAPAKKTDASYVHGNGAGATVQNSLLEAQKVRLPATYVPPAGANVVSRGVAAAVRDIGAYCIDNTGSSRPIKIICETPEPNRYVDNGGYSISISDPTYNAAGITADDFVLSGIDWTQLQVVNNWDGS